MRHECPENSHLSFEGVIFSLDSGKLKAIASNEPTQRLSDEEVQQVIRRLARFNVGIRRTILHCALERGKNPKLIEAILTHFVDNELSCNEELLLQADELGRTPLFLAVDQGNLGVVKAIKNSRALTAAVFYKQKTGSTDTVLTVGSTRLLQCKNAIMALEAELVSCEKRIALRQKSLNPANEESQEPSSDDTALLKALQHQKTMNAKKLKKLKEQEADFANICEELIELNNNYIGNDELLLQANKVGETPLLIAVDQGNLRVIKAMKNSNASTEADFDKQKTGSAGIVLDVVGRKLRECRKTIEVLEGELAKRGQEISSDDKALLEITQELKNLKEKEANFTNICKERLTFHICPPPSPDQSLDNLLNKLEKEADYLLSNQAGIAAQAIKNLVIRFREIAYDYSASPYVSGNKGNLQAFKKTCKMIFDEELANNKDAMEQISAHKGVSALLAQFIKFLGRLIGRSEHGFFAAKTHTEQLVDEMRDIIEPRKQAG